HNCGDRRIEVPSSLEIIAHTLNGLVKLALDLPRLGRQPHPLRRRRRSRLCCGRIPHHKPIHTPEEALNTFDPRILPIEIAIRRRGEQAVEARGISAETRYHFVWGDHVPQAL